MQGAMICLLSVFFYWLRWNRSRHHCWKPGNIFQICQKQFWEGWTVIDCFPKFDTNWASFIMSSVDAQEKHFEALQEKNVKDYLLYPLGQVIESFETMTQFNVFVVQTNWTFEHSEYETLSLRLFDRESFQCGLPNDHLSPRNFIAGPAAVTWTHLLSNKLFLKPHENERLWNALHLTFLPSLHFPSRKAVFFDCTTC